MEENVENKSLLRYTIFALIVLILIVGCLYFLLANKEESEKKDNSNNQDNVSNENNNNQDDTINRDNLFTNVLENYIIAVRMKINEASDFRFYDTRKILMIPVGNIDNTCVTLEQGENSPYSSKWNYAYVGVIFTGEGYEYYMIAKDGANYGISFVSYTEKNNTVVEKDINKEYDSLLTSKYSITSNDIHKFTDIEKELFKSVIDNNSSIDTVIYISSKTCNYKS